MAIYGRLSRETIRKTFLPNHSSTRSKRGPRNNRPGSPRRGLSCTDGSNVVRSLIVTATDGTRAGRSRRCAPAVAGVGRPGNPGAWLMATAKHRFIDHFRRNTLHDRKHQEIGRERQMQQEMAVPDFEAALDDDIGDDLLRLLFISCVDGFRWP